jgi:hypothetical protein
MDLEEHQKQADIELGFRDSFSWNKAGRWVNRHYLIEE